jgi:hypothetical protein
MILRLFRLAGAGLLVAGLILAGGPLKVKAQLTTDSGKSNNFYFLNKEFFEYMEKLSRANDHTYGDRQEPLLQQISVASQFMVKTNLTIIKQNDRIIQLLEELNRKRLLQEK